MKKEDEKLLQRARKRFKKLHDAELEIKGQFVEDMKFAFNIDSGQWTEADVTARDKEKRPHLTMNKLSKFVALVVNAEKGQPNTDDVIPVDDKGDKFIAQAYNEIINDIEYRSEAEDAYNLAAEYAVAGGFGYWRILTEYIDDGFDQELRIEPIKNPCMVSLDPRGMYGYIREKMPMEEFEEKYPKVEKVHFEDRAGFDDYELWYDDDSIAIAEYFEKVPTEKEIVEFINPVTGETAVVERTRENEGLLASFEIERSRTVKTHKVMWYKITGENILEEQEWPGKDIPIIEVSGHEVHLLGKTYKKSLITDAKDPQRMYNYWLTSLTEKVALAPKAPFLVTEQQIKGHVAQWDDANTKNFPYLLYNSSGGTMPQRQIPAPIDQGAMTLLGISNGDIKDTLGMFESSMGMPSNERSAKAINARTARSDLGTYSFQDNLRKSRQKTKKMLIDLIPKIYDNARVIRLRGTDKVLEINFETVFEGRDVVINDLSKGRYDIRVKTSGTPSRRQQAVDNIFQIMQYAPNLADLLAPVALQFLDTPGGEEMVQAIMPAIQQRQQEGAEPKKK